VDQQCITIAMSDDEQGVPHTSPDSIVLGALVSFAEDVQTFLKGQKRDIDPDSLHVAVVNGSFALTTEQFHPSDRLRHDLVSLLNSPLLDAIDRKRREVVERWQKLAKAKGDTAFKIAAPFLDRPIIIDKSTDYRRDDADRWVAVERYVHGVITELGGSTNSNLHLRLRDGTLLIVSAKKDVLRDDDVNRVYKSATLRVKAQFNVTSHELRDATLIEFVDYDPAFDEAAFEEMTARGTEAWKDVKNAAQWVDEQRGN